MVFQGYLNHDGNVQFVLRATHAALGDARGCRDNAAQSVGVERQDNGYGGKKLETGDRIPFILGLQGIECCCRRADGKANKKNKTQQHQDVHLKDDRPDLPNREGARVKDQERSV